MRTIQLTNSSGEQLEAEIEGAQLKTVAGSPVTFIRQMQSAVMVRTEAEIHYIERQSYARQVLGVSFY